MIITEKELEKMCSAWQSQVDWGYHTCIPAPVWQAQQEALEGPQPDDDIAF